MKTTLRLTTIALIILTLFSCRRDDNLDDDTSSGGGNARTECYVSFKSIIADTNSMPIGVNFQNAVKNDSRLGNVYFYITSFRINTSYSFSLATPLQGENPNCQKIGDKQFWEDNLTYPGYHYFELVTKIDSTTAMSKLGTHVDTIQAKTNFWELNDKSKGFYRIEDYTVNRTENYTWTKNSVGISFIYDYVNATSDRRYIVDFNFDGSGYFEELNNLTGLRKITVWNVDGSGSYVNEVTPSSSFTW